jgi:hypothetical protein
MFGVIEKSGTGIGKSGTGIATGRIGGSLIAAGLLLTAGISSALAQEHPTLQVTQQGNSLMVSIHGENRVIAGMAALENAQDAYLAIPLYSVLQLSEGGDVHSPMVRGSGSGTSSGGCGASLMVQGSGSGAAGESCDSGDAQLLVQGSGSGASGESCTPVAELMVQGSGSGASGQSKSPGASLMVQGSGSGAPDADQSQDVMVRGSGSGASGQSTGAGLMVQGSGSGASGQSVDVGLLVQGSGSGSSGQSCIESSGLWGIAEVVVDPTGTHVLVHQVSDNGLNEYLVAFDRNTELGTMRMAPEFVALP